MLWPHPAKGEVINWHYMEADDVAYTLCLPYDYSVPDGAKAYTLNNCSGSELVFTEVETMSANMPYLVVTSTTIDNFNANEVRMQVKTADHRVQVAGYEFRGTLEQIAYEAATALNAYILLSYNQWHPITEGSWAYIPAQRAYIVATQSGARPLLSTRFDGEATQISTLKTINADGTEQVFDLSGRRISSAGSHHGIYIKNGKKHTRKKNHPMNKKKEYAAPQITIHLMASSSPLLDYSSGISDTPANGPARMPMYDD